MAHHVPPPTCRPRGMSNDFQQEEQREQATKSNDSNRRLLFAMVCANNVNRSAEAHLQLQTAGLRVRSFGISHHVCLPSKDPMAPYVFEFSTTYETILHKLQQEDQEFFSRNGVLEMLERNMQIKSKPDRWQELSTKEVLTIDVVLCFDARIFLIVIEDLKRRCSFGLRKKHLHVLCLNTDDTAREARKNAQVAVQLCQRIDQQDPLVLQDHRLESIVEEFQRDLQVKVAHVKMSFFH